MQMPSLPAKIDAEQTERSKYETDDAAAAQQGRVFTRLAFGMLLANAVLTVKDMIHGNAAKAATSGQPASEFDDPLNENNGPNAPALMAPATEQAEERDAAATSAGAPDQAFDLPRGKAVGPVKAYQRGDSLVLFDTDAQAAPVATGVPLLSVLNSAFGSGVRPVDPAADVAARSGGSSGSAAPRSGARPEASATAADGEDDRLDFDGGEPRLEVGDTAPQADDDQGTDDQGGAPRQSNRAPVVNGPVVLGATLINQSFLIGLSDLLSQSSDADGDDLVIGDLQASSGELTRRGADQWLFTPESGQGGEVVLSYVVSDGLAAVSQNALLDVEAPAGREIEGSADADRLIGTPYSDRIDAGAGDDIVLAREGDDVIDGGTGNDRLLGGEGDDVIHGGAGDDIVFAGAGNDVVNAGAGDDVVHGESGDDVLSGEAGNDTLLGGSGRDLLSGDDGDDRLDGGDGIDLLLGGSGADRLSGDAGSDTLVGEQGADTLDGGDGDDIIVAIADDGDDLIDGGSGVDTYDLSATSAPALVDLMAGHAGSTDTGTDQLRSIENVVGSSGDDRIVASEEVNRFSGGSGHDVFVFVSSQAAGQGRGSRDSILDFEIGDRIDLDEISREFADEFEDVFEDQGISRFVLIRDGEAFDRPGELRIRYELLDGRQVTIIEGNIDRDAETEFEIELWGDLRDDMFGFWANT